MSVGETDLFDRAPEEPEGVEHVFDSLPAAGNAPFPDAAVAPAACDAPRPQAAAPIMENVFASLPAAGGAPHPCAAGEVPADVEDIFAALPEEAARKRRRVARDGAEPREPGLARWQRNPRFMKVVRRFKKMKYEHQGAAPARAVASNLGRAWNTAKGLRASDRFVMRQRMRRGANSRHLRKSDKTTLHTKPHPDAWDLSIAMQKAFGEVGGDSAQRRKSKHGEVGEFGGRALFGVSFSAGVFIKAQESEHDKLRGAVLAGLVRTMTMVNAYDLTPILCVFGSLATELIPHARYLHLEGSEWKLLTLEKYQALGNRGTPRRGVLELFAQRVEVYYRQGMERRSGSSLIMPRVLRDQQAGSIFSACESATKIWSMEGIRALCQHLVFFLVCEAPDGCSANLRKIYGMAIRLPENAFLASGPCVVHQVHRIVVISTDESDLIGDIYSIKYVSHLAGHFNRLYRILRHLVEELRIVRRRDVSDADFQRWQQHIDDVLEHTFLRRVDITRGRMGEDVLFEGADEQRQRDVVRKVRMFINGDIRIPRCTVVLTDELEEWLSARAQSEEDRERELKDGFFAALLELNVLLGAGSRLPSKGRWGSLTVSNSEFARGRSTTIHWQILRPPPT